MNKVEGAATPIYLSTIFLFLFFFLYFMLFVNCEFYNNLFFLLLLFIIVVSIVVFIVIISTTLSHVDDVFKVHHLILFLLNPFCSVEIIEALESIKCDLENIPVSFMPFPNYRFYSYTYREKRWLLVFGFGSTSFDVFNSAFSSWFYLLILELLGSDPLENISYLFIFSFSLLITYSVSSLVVLRNLAEKYMVILCFFLDQFKDTK